MPRGGRADFYTFQRAEPSHGCWEEAGREHFLLSQQQSRVIRSNYVGELRWDQLCHRPRAGQGRITDIVVRRDLQDHRSSHHPTQRTSGAGRGIQGEESGGRHTWGCDGWMLTQRPRSPEPGDEQRTVWDRMGFPIQQPCSASRMGTRSTSRPRRVPLKSVQMGERI